MTPVWKRWGGILGLALAVRAVVAFVLLRSMPQVHDAASYVEFAGTLLTDFPGHEGYYWPPGNSMALAGVFAVLGSSGFAVRLLMLAVSLGGVVLTALLAGQLDDRAAAGDTRSQTWTGVLAALYMPAVMLVGEGYSQHLAALTLLAVAYCGLRAVRERKAWMFVVAGLAFGFGCLTRPSMVSIAPVLLVAWVAELLRARKAAAGGMMHVLAGGVVFAAITAGVVMPVVLHNRAHDAGLTISTNNERNFFLGNNPYTPSYKTSHLGQRALEELDEDTRAYLESFYSRPDARSAMQSEAVSFVLHHPLQTAYRTVNRFTSFWGFDYLASRIIQEDRGWGTTMLMPLLAVEAGSYILAMVLAIAGFFAFKNECEPFWRRQLTVLAFVYEIPYVLAFSGGTYHFPVIGLLLPFAGIAASRLFAKREGGAMRDARASVRASKATWVVVGVFVLIQVQYAYYSIALKG